MFQHKVKRDAYRLTRRVTLRHDTPKRHVWCPDPRPLPFVFCCSVLCPPFSGFAKQRRSILAYAAR